MKSPSAALVRGILLALAVAALAACIGVAAPANAGPRTDSPGEAQALRALLASQEAQLVAGDGAADDWFGYSVAISGDTAVVGAPWHDFGANADQGSAYVFVRSGSTWSLQAQLFASNGAADDWFGISVAISGDTAVVGASYDDVGGEVQQGSAYVFVRSGSTWSEQVQLLAGDGSTWDGFGRAVAISGDTAVVGAVTDDVGANADQGSAYVFVRNGSTWGQQAHLTAADGSASDFFGGAVAISGDTAVVGASYDGAGTNDMQGSAYVFMRSGAVWGLQAHLAAADGAWGDLFGMSVAISGDTAVVGASEDDVGANRDQGSAYVFARSGSTWSQQAHLTAADGASDEWFGWSVGVSGDTAVVGAPRHVVGAKADQGSAYAFARSGSTWSQQAQLSAVDGAADDWLGMSVAISGDTAVVGAYRNDVGVVADQGSASAFRFAKPGRPTAKSPKGTISGRTPTLRWTRPAGAANYEVRIYKGSKLLKKQTGLVKTSWKCTKRLPRQAWLTWKVRARNVAGYGAWSGKLRFKVR